MHKQAALYSFWHTHAGRCCFFDARRRWSVHLPNILLYLDYAYAHVWRVSSCALSFVTVYGIQLLPVEARPEAAHQLTTPPPPTVLADLTAPSEFIAGSAPPRRALFCARKVHDKLVFGKHFSSPPHRSRTPSMLTSTV